MAMEQKINVVILQVRHLLFQSIAFVFRRLIWDGRVFLLHSQGLWARAHMMKIYWIVIGPHILWIQASNNTNVARSVEMTFGQVSTRPLVLVQSLSKLRRLSLTRAS